jgi:protocatechuate 3,4-dioxygenase beta subunit
VEGTIVEIGSDDRIVTADVVLKAACTVAGKVVDPEGNPMGGARVSVAKPDWARYVPFRFDLTGGADVHTVSEKDGSFRLPGVNAGEAVRLTATMRGYAPGRSPDLKLEPGQEIPNVELKLGAGGLVTGTVRTSEGDPVVGALVRVAPTGQEWSLVWGAGDPDPVRTDEQGRFEKPVFGTDPVAVRVDADGFVSETVSKVEIEEDAAREELSITLRASLSITGTVLGPDNEPVVDAFVRARFEGRRRGFQDLSAYSDGAGAFRIEGLDAGKYTIITQSSVAPEQRLEKIDAGTAGVVIRLPRGRRIQGHVVGPASEPIANVSLRADRTGGGRARTSTDEAGAFVFDNLQEGKWRIRYRPDAGNPDAFLEAEIRDVTTGTHDVLLTLREGLEIEGRILDSAGGGARGATVVITSKDDRRSTFTTTGGAFRFGGLPEGTWSLTVTGASGEAGRIDGVSSGTLDVLLQLEAALAIAGRVLDPTGRPPIDPVYVAATPEGSKRAIAFATTDPDGSFALSGLPSGRYVVTSGDNDKGLEASTTVPAGTSNVLLRLQHKKD